MHETDVVEDHDAVRQAKESKAIVAVASRPPKLSPVTVTDAIADVGALSDVDVTVAESKLNAIATVPATAPTVNATHRSEPPYASPCLHSTLDDVVQEAVQHDSTATVCVAVGSLAPKLLPVTMSARWPEVGALCGSEAVSSGASKLNTATCVPATAPTVSMTKESVLYAATVRQATEVDDVQEAVRHGLDAPNEDVPVSS